jgi:hypothetical protein
MNGLYNLILRQQELQLLQQSEQMMLDATVLEGFSLLQFVCK